ncbi:hypothetical protein [Escherichia coli]|uniref:hypothetical protein n=1 Tax=Escherichia coli TaxID=562 RepID=UPI000A89DA62|nr:hypothetical protein [Escherichia coli]
MNIGTETREILRNYKAVINARRREMGQSPLPFPFVMCPECFFLMLFFCGYRACYCSSSSSKAQRRFAHALSVVAAGPCSLPAGCHTPV